MKFQYDQEADALMITIKDGLVARTEMVDSGTLLDLDQQGTLLGIEVIRPARDWPLDEILSRYEMSEADSQALRALWRAEGGEDTRYPFVRETVFA
jgi:uncharacterized protein YuzE